MRTVAAILSGIPEHNIRVISPDIGGGFGNKVGVYPGYICSIVIFEPPDLSADAFLRRQLELAEIHGMYYRILQYLSDEPLRPVRRQVNRRRAGERERGGELAGDRTQSQAEMAVSESQHGVIRARHFTNHRQ